MKTARLQVLTTPAFRDWLRKEARNAGVSVAELVRTRCEHKPTGEEVAVAKLASHLHQGSPESPSLLEKWTGGGEFRARELRAERERRRSAGR
jgi:hypothetical protein